MANFRFVDWDGISQSSDRRESALILTLNSFVLFWFARWSSARINTGDHMVFVCQLGIFDVVAQHLRDYEYSIGVITRSDWDCKNDVNLNMSSWHFEFETMSFQKSSSQSDRLFQERNTDSAWQGFWRILKWGTNCFLFFHSIYSEIWKIGWALLWVTVIDVIIVKVS